MSRGCKCCTNSPLWLSHGSHLLWQWQPHNWQYSNNHPLCHLCGQFVLLLLHHTLSCSSSKLTILRTSLAKFTGTCQTFQSPESPKHTFSHTKGSLQSDGLSHHIWRVLTLVSGITFPFERINHAQSGMIYQASHQGLQHPLKWKYLFPSATVIIWVFQCDHELTTLPRVYSSRSCVCPLFHSKNHALLLRESLALSSKSPGSSPPLTMGAAH